jgi:dolichol-phosphate mannosyltransferase
MRREKLGVVIPLANERDTIDALLSRVTAQLAPHDEIYCVLDRVSTDGTRDLIEAFGQRDRRVRCVWAPENRCVVDAYFRGYREALAGDCDWILEMDGGLSHLPEEMPRFLAAMASGTQFAPGSRFVTGGAYRGRWTRKCISLGGSLLARLMLGTKMVDMTSGFECFSRAAMQHVVDHGVRSRAHFFQTEIRYLLSTWSWQEIPITYSNPSDGVGAGTIAEALKNLWRLARSGRPPLPALANDCSLKTAA